MACERLCIALYRNIETTLRIQYLWGDRRDTSQKGWEPQKKIKYPVYTWIGHLVSPRQTLPER